MIDNGLLKLCKYARLASELYYCIQPPQDPVQINDVEEITTDIIMNTIMAVQDELRADWINWRIKPSHIGKRNKNKSPN